MTDNEQQLPNACNWCPRECGADRAHGKHGACGAGASIRVARSALHFWEEPPLSGTRGSGAVFFSHCPMRCIFCQNADISRGGVGADVDVRALATMMLELEQDGAHNVNLVTPTHYAPLIACAVDEARQRGLGIPVVYNSSGYETVRIVDLMSRRVEVWLPDFKYASPSLAWELSGVRDYPAQALRAIERMVGHAGQRRLDDEGIMRAGVIVRHLVLPGHIDDSLNALSLLWERFGNTIDLSVMGQYTPFARTQLGTHPELAEHLDRQDYDAVLDWADILGFENVWWQTPGSDTSDYTPDFDLTGVCAGGRQ